jgi:multimeric flavodoxin WrbA
MTYCALLASSRSDGNTRLILDRAFPQGIGPLEDFNALKIGFYSYSFEHEGDDFFLLINRMLAHDLWIIATPVYWYTMSGQAKVFFDRLTDLLETHKDEGRRLRGKSLAVIATGTEPTLPQSFEAPFRLTCDYLGMHFRGAHYTQFLSANTPAAPLDTGALDFIQSIIGDENG